MVNLVGMGKNMWKKGNADLEMGQQDGAHQVASRKLSQTITATGVERFFDKNEIIVSKTDLKGNLTYVNNVFLRISDYTEAELLGQPHSLIRHVDMPRAIFKLLWDYLQDGKEIFAYVNNFAKNGDNYWVLAHVTPSFDDVGNVVGYHSNRRVPDAEILANTIIPLYKQLKDIENGDKSRKIGLQKSEQKLKEIVADQGVSYDEFILSL